MAAVFYGRSNGRFIKWKIDFDEKNYLAQISEPIFVVAAQAVNSV